MPSSSPLDVPAEWPVESKGRFVLAFGALVVLGAVSVGVGLVAVGIGFSGAAKYALVIAALFWLTAAFAPAIPALLAVAAAVFFASYFVLLALGRIRRGRIVLAPDGIHQEGRAFESFLPWDSFAGVQPSYNGTREVLAIACSNAPWRKRQLAGPWRLDKLPPVPMIEINTIHLAAEPTLVYHLLRFYSENQSARGELGTEAVPRRIREQSF